MKTKHFVLFFLVCMGSFLFFNELIGAARAWLGQQSCFIVGCFPRGSAKPLGPPPPATMTTTVGVAGGFFIEVYYRYTPLQEALKFESRKYSLEQLIYLLRRYW